MPAPNQASRNRIDSGLIGVSRTPWVLTPEPPPELPRRPRPWLAIGAVVLIVAAAAIAWRSSGQSQRAARSEPVFTRTAVVQRGQIEETILLTGVTGARNSVLLRAPYMRGRGSRRNSTYYALVLQSLVPSGSHVKKGDLVASFDMIAMRNRLDDLQADRVDAELRLKTLAAELLVKRTAYQQQVRQAKAVMDKAALDMRTAPVRSAIQVAQFKLAFEEAKARYQALAAQAKLYDAGEAAQIRMAKLEAREAAVEEQRAAANVERMQVRAPVDGMAVVQEIFRGGQMNRIRAGDQLRSRQSYLEIVDARSLIVEAKANQVDVERLRMGAKARVRFDAFPGLELPAHVYAISPIANASRARAGYVAEVPVFLKIDRKDDPRLIPDLAVSASVVLDQAKSESIVPREAVFTSKTGETFAYVRKGDSWEKRRIELGLANHVAVEVRAGLQAGERVAASLPEA